MRITKLKIFGFKSFAQRTEINFPGNGLTAVVGPNGCGKSNIVDAIRWVLGEQRAAVLRMGKMQDVIFSGTEERAAMSMAEVSLVINNDDGKLPSEYSEIMVTRRAYRNGTSEYLLNNQECRLKDVQNLFFDSGLGTGTYSQMNERMINAVLSDKAEDRRTLFEEAAGVSKYKKQRKETVSKMTSVQQSMERVEDNLRHTRNSVRQYERQAEKAKEWMRLRSRLKDLDLSVSVDKWTDNKEALKILNDSHKRLDHEVETNQTRLLTLKTQIDERRLAISEDENNLRDLQQQVSQETLNLNNLNNESTRLRDKERSLEEASNKAKTEIENTEIKIQELELEMQNLEMSISGLEQSDNVSMQESILERDKEALQVLKDSCDDLRTASKELSEKRLACIQKINNLKNKFGRLDAETELHKKSIFKLETDLKPLKELEEQTKQILLKADEEALHYSDEIALLKEQTEVLQNNLEDKQNELTEKKQTLQILKQEEAALNSKLDILAKLDNNATDGSAWILKNKAEYITHSVGEILEARTEYLNQIEFALGEALDSLILKNENDVFSLIQDLENAKAGTALLALLPENLKEKEPLNLTETLGNAAHFIKTTGALGNFARHLLSNWYLVENFEKAFELAKKYKENDFWFLSQDNKAVHTSGFVRTGKPKTSAMMSRRAEIQETEEKLNLLSEKIKNTESKIDSIQNHLEEEESVYTEKKSDLIDFEEKLRTLEASKRIQNNTLQSLFLQIKKIETDISEANEKILKAESEKTSDIELKNAEEESLKVETEYENISNRLEEEEQLLRNKEDDVQETERLLRDSKNTLSSFQNKLYSLQAQRPVFENIIKSRTEELTHNSIELKKLKESIDIIAENINSKHEELSVLERKRDEAQERYNVVSGDLEDWRSEERAINEKLMKLMPDIKDIELRAEAVRENTKRLKERIFAEWELDIEDTENIRTIEYDANAEKEIRDLKAKIKALGPVNQGIMEDYEEEKKRLEEIEKQFDDLDRARASLERTIKRLDIIARERFMDTFHKIQRNFQEVFSRLMKDGGTKLTLEENVDPLEAEIEVNARPTGKKMRGVKALSGGERALTAVSLLFAIYMEKPSPYCVLDEVDGPLDDANIGRFVELLRHFSRQTQFILVTHNKRTMAASDMLYGVTQEIKGISRIASVKLEDVNPNKL